MSNISNRYAAYVGTYTNGSSKGIYIFGFDANTGRLELTGSASELKNPSYLAVDKDSKYLYSVAETNEFDGKPSGGVGAFSIDRQTGALSLLNIQPSGGKAPCHISTDVRNEYLFAANYAGGTVTVYPLQADGCIGQLSSTITHHGSGPNRERQEKSHVHYVTLTPDQKYLCAVDLGIDSVIVYDFDRLKGHISLEKSLSVSVKPGSGPRHMEFRPDGKFAYLVTELSCDIIVFRYSSIDGTFIPEQHISTLPEGFTGTSYCAAIHVSSDGRYLYASNRGHDSIAVFNIDQTSGELKLIGHISTFGKFPRDFAIDPTGRFLFAANQNSGTIVPFAVIPESGKLEQAGDIIEVPSPVCIKFAHLE